MQCQYEGVRDSAFGRDQDFPLAKLRRPGVTRTLRFDLDALPIRDRAALRSSSCAQASSNE